MRWAVQAMQTDWCRPHHVLRPETALARESRRHLVALIRAAGCRIYSASVLRQPANDGLVAARRASHHPQTRPAADAEAGIDWHGTWSQHQPCAPAAQDLSVLAARLADCPAEPSVEYRHHVCSAGTRIRVPGRHHGLVQSQGIVMEVYSGYFLDIV